MHSTINRIPQINKSPQASLYHLVTYVHKPDMTEPATPPVTPIRGTAARTVTEKWSPSSPDSPLVYGPSNPYDPKTASGREFLYFRNRIAYPKPVDKWIQANLSSCYRPDPRSITTSLCAEEVLCQLEIAYLSVSSVYY